MKKIFSILVIIMVIVFIGFQTSYAQYPQIRVHWEEPPDCDCPTAGDFYYRIDVMIVNECGEEFFTEWQDYEIVPGTASYVDFYPDWSCNYPLNDPCYLVTGEIKKLCPDCDCSTAGDFYYRIDMDMVDLQSNVSANLMNSDHAII